jgi:hypothetical protein
MTYISAISVRLPFELSAIRFSDIYSMFGELKSSDSSIFLIMNRVRILKKGINAIN